MVRWLVDTDSGDWTGSGYDAQYSNLETAMADAYDLVAATESLTIECTSSAGILADTTAVVVDAPWNTSADYTLTIKAHENDVHGGTNSSSGYQLTPLINKTGIYVEVGINNVTIKDLIVKYSGTYNNQFGIKFADNANCLLDNIYVESSQTGTGSHAIHVDSNAGSDQITVKNCLVVSTVSTVSTGINSSGNFYGVNVYNCVVYGQFGDGIGGYPDRINNAFNNIIIGCTADDYADAVYSGDHNVSSDLTAPGTNYVHSFDHSTLFPNAATGDFRPSIPYVDALGTTWGAGAIPWQRDVVVDTSASSIFTDNFDRATIGTDWTVITDIDDIVTESSTVASGLTAGRNGSYLNTAVLSSDQYAECEIYLNGATEASGPAIRVQSDSNSHYFVEVTATTIQLKRFNLNSWADISTAEPITFSAGDVVGIKAFGTTITAYHNGVDIVSVQDSTHTSGYAGLYVYGSDPYFDNFECGNFAHYSSLAAAEAGEQIIGDDLALRNEKLVISCTSGGTTNADTTAVTIDANWLTSKTCDFTVQGEADGVWDDSKYALVAAAGGLHGCVDLYSANYNINYLQVENIDNTDNAASLHLRASGRVCGCIFRNGRKTLYSNLASTDIVNVSNCIIYGAALSNVFDESTTGAKVYLNSLTCYDSVGDSIWNYNGSNVLIPINCICINSSDFCFTGIDSVTCLTNISSDGTAPDNSTSYTVYYEDTDTLPVVPEDCVIFKSATDFRLVSHMVEDYTGTMVETNSAIGKGTYLSDLSVDNAGKSRQPYDFKGIRTARAFDIGAWQAPAQLTYVVDTDGVSGDYGNLATAFAGLQADSTNLVESNLLPIISCQASTNIEDANYVEIDAITANVDCFITFLGDGIYTLIPDGSEAYNIRNLGIDYLLAKNIKIKAPIDDYDYAIRVTDSIKNTFDTIIIDGQGNHVSTSTIGIAGGINPIFKNCIIHNGFSSGAFYGAGDDAGTIFKNCTAYSIGGDGFSSGYHDAVITDCIAVDCGICYESEDSSSNNYISSDLTGDITGLTSDYFADPANGDFTPVASAGDLTSYSASANSTVTVGAIPFVDEKIVDTGGTGDYVNLASWESYAQGACVDGETCQATMINTDDAAFSSEVLFDGTTAGVFYKLYVDPEYRHSGLAGASPTHTRLYVGSGAHVIQVNNAINLEIEGLDIQQSSLQNSDECIRIAGTAPNTTLTLTDCILWFPTRVYQQDCVYSEGDNSTYAFRNCVFANAERAGLDLYTAEGEQNVEIRNCTFSDIGFADSAVGRSGVVGIYINDVANVSAVSNVFNMFGGFTPFTSQIAPTTTKHIINNNVTNDTAAFDVVYLSGTNSFTVKDNVASEDFTGDFVSTTDFHTTDSPYELWGADAAYAGAFGDEPYEVVRVVDTDGGADHLTMQAAIDWYGTNSRVDLAGRNEHAIITCTGSLVDIGRAIIPTSFTTDALHKVKIYGDGSYIISANGTANDCIYFRTTYGELHNLVATGVNGAAKNGIYTAGYEEAHLIVNSCTVYNIKGDRDSSCIRLGNENANNELTVINCCLFDADGPGILSSNAYSSIIRAFNNTIYNCNQSLNSFRGGISLADPQIFSIMNNIAVDNGNEDFEDNCSIDYNISSDATATGANSHTLETAANLFVDAEGGDFRLKSTATNAIGGGVDLSHIFTTDITGATR